MKVTYIDHMGSDLSVVNAARVSFGKTSEWANKESVDAGQWHQYELTKQDQSLISFLARGCTSGDWESLKDEAEMHFVGGGTKEQFEDLLNHIRKMPSHWTPFGHTAISLHLKVPIFVARQIMKHQAGFVVNEVSRRYVTDEPEFYVPDTWRKAAENVKQGSSDEPLDIEGQRVCLLCKEPVTCNHPANKDKKKFCSPKCQQKFYRSYTNEGWAATKATSLKASAKKRGILFDLTKEDLLELGLPIKCKYLEVELDYVASELKPNSPSVNRIDSSKGYVKGNLEIISNKANSMLLNATQEEMKLFLKNVSFEQFGIFFDESNSVDGYYENQKKLYKELIDSGLCAEQARGFMPQSQMTEFWMTGNLYGWANLYNQRIDPHAQRETQEVAKQIGEIVAPLFPESWKELTK